MSFVKTTMKYRKISQQTQRSGIIPSYIVPNTPQIMISPVKQIYTNRLKSSSFQIFFTRLDTALQHSLKIQLLQISCTYSILSLNLQCQLSAGSNPLHWRPDYACSRTSPGFQASSCQPSSQIERSLSSSNKYVPTTVRSFFNLASKF